MGGGTIIIHVVMDWGGGSDFETTIEVAGLWFCILAYHELAIYSTGRVEDTISALTS